jgi:multidrug resistance efflux pump
MNIVMNRLDPNVPDPVESRRRAAGRLVRMTYAAAVFGVLGFFIVYFGAPLVYLSGPGTVASAPYVISLPYTVQVVRVNVAAGAIVSAGDEIGQVLSPEQDTIIATYMRSLAEIAGRSAELRVKARVAEESLEPARSYRRETEEVMERVEAMSSTATFRLEIIRERALAKKNVVSFEAEAAEAKTQLASLDAFKNQIRQRLDEVERNFANGRILAPINGIISTGLAHRGQSLVAGTPIAVVLDPKDAYVDWYIPNERLIDPKVGNDVLVLFGNRRIHGKIVQILPVSAVYGGASRQAALRDRPATQIARVRFNQDESPPALNSTVRVHMHYSRLSAWIAEGLITVFGLD